ncbi:hypothetical protein J5N97_008099 [Dioscorea zingiberensis]|uniref:Phytocyanin domain-containing protein n=1 Tax=Dioscorea zingiberensis TaxID=325984 RepID=A0A9D5DD30_9LILI|nr:hypothetical protein J5N97_008099 [Dioscorea zingiberensis]
MACFVSLSHFVLVFVVVVVVMRCEGSGAVKDHVVGGDQGWDAASNIAAWSMDKIFRVGDNIWFTYSAAQGVVEVKSKEEFEFCDISNPIRMLTGGLEAVVLEGEGSRYFIGGRPEDCRNGLKLHVQVMPQADEIGQLANVVQVVADGPEPSSSSHLGVFMSALLLIGLVVICFIEF